MGRSPCCDQDANVKKGPWTPEEDKLLVDYINEHGHGSWRRLPKLAGLNRCGKSCRLRWTNYLRPDIKRGRFTEDEEKLIIHLHSVLGNKWSSIATKLPGRTDNEIKNYWNTHLRKKLLGMGIDPVTHQRRTDLNLLAAATAGIPNLLAAAAGIPAAAQATTWDINALRLQADAAKYQLLEGLIRALTVTATAPVAAAPQGVDLMTLLAAANGGLGGLAGLGHHSPAGGSVDGQQQQQAGAGATGIGRVVAQQYDGLLNLPALTSVVPPAVVTAGMSPSSFPFSAGMSMISGGYAGDGLSSTELGHSGPSRSNTTAATAMAPAPLVASDECNAGGGSRTRTPCEGTPASSPFEGLDSLNLDDELLNIDSWKDMLE
ncbi:hypothetical protein U9M48_030124 [Paspalum notatum var. saurae]|uniref:MYB transcription factor n=1 Tax=Paspalum notatum var. saurae TaxID=547442 RepID=A0AAQ3X1T4_PASNO